MFSARRVLLCPIRAQIFDAVEKECRKNDSLCASADRLYILFYNEELWLGKENSAAALTGFPVPLIFRPEPSSRSKHLLPTSIATSQASD